MQTYIINGQGTIASLLTMNGTSLRIRVRVYEDEHPFTLSPGNDERTQSVVQLIEIVILYIPYNPLDIAIHFVFMGTDMGWS